MSGKCSILGCKEPSVLQLWTTDGQFVNWFCLAHGMKYRALGYKEQQHGTDRRPDPR